MGKVVCSRQLTPATQVMSWQLPDWAAEALQADTVTSKLADCARSEGWHTVKLVKQITGKAGRAASAQRDLTRPGIVIDGIITPASRRTSG